jgi:nitrogenase cofactor biosynthesis protein NifB
MFSPQIEKKTAAHPCFNCGAAHQNARIHLPIAPKCNIQCNYCVRKFDCPNESRPGVASEILSPEAAFQKYAVVKQQMPNLTVVGIAGPGDALANFDETKETLQRIKAHDSEVVFCLSTNGLALPEHAEELLNLGVSHLTVTMNAVDPAIGEKIYKHINLDGKHITGREAAEILLANQLKGLEIMARAGIVCKVNCVAIKGVNDRHIAAVTKKASELGAYIANIMPLIPVKGSVFEDMPMISNKEIAALREESGINILQMKHCRQCRADAIGTLDNDRSIDYRALSETAPPTQKKRFAVASKSGTLVDQHFGHAEEFYIYESDGAKTAFIERRSVEKYCTGAEACDDKDSIMEGVLKACSDCDGVLALRIGYSPTEKLKAKGIRVITTYDRIEHAVAQAASE